MKKRNNVRQTVIAGLLILIMIAPAVTTQAADMPEISILAQCAAEIPAEDASIVQAIRDESGIDVQPIYISSADYQSRLSAYIASGDLPDIIRADSATALELIKYGMVADISGLLEEYGQNILADGEDRLTFGINGDGAVYGLPHSKSYAMIMGVRRDWMRNLGYEVGDESVIEMTMDAFTQLMYEFTYDDPDGNGVNDTFGMCAQANSLGMFSPIFTAYGIPVDNQWASFYYDDETGECHSFIKHPRFLEAIETLRYMYQNGCMDTEFAVVPDASTEFGFLWNSTAGAGSWSPAGTTNNWLGRYTEEGVTEDSFVYVNITDNEGLYGGFVTRYDGAWLCVTSSCEDPATAVKLIDYFYSVDGEALAYLGIEGTHYEWNDESRKSYTMLGDYQDKSNQRADGGWILWSSIHPDNNIELNTLTQITTDAINYAEEHKMANEAVFYGTPEIAGELGSLLTDHIIVMISNLIVADGDITEMYENYVDEYNGIGGLTYEEQATEIFKSENGLN